MKVSGITKWIVIDLQASSMYHVIATGVASETTAGKNTWKSLIAGSSLQSNCNKEGFNLECDLNDDIYAHVRIGIVANNENDCNTCDSYIGFGASFQGCGVNSTITCGNFATCSPGPHYNDNAHIPAHGYILVQ
jgi:hypothetical protein